MGRMVFCLSLPTTRDKLLFTLNKKDCEQGKKLILNENFIEFLGLGPGAVYLYITTFYYVAYW